MISIRLPRILLTAAALTLMLVQVASAQRIRSDDPVIQQMWTLGMEESQTEDLAQVLTDFIGPRLAGSYELEAAADWAVSQFEGWGVPARKEQYGPGTAGSSESSTWTLSRPGFQRWNLKSSHGARERTAP